MPGAGHWRLGLRLRAYCFIVPTVILLGVMLGQIAKIVGSQMDDLSKLQNSGALKIAAKLSEKAAAVPESGDMSFITFLLIACYVASIADLIWLYQSEATLPEK